MFNIIMSLFLLMPSPVLDPPQTIEPQGLTASCDTFPAFANWPLGVGFSRNCADPCSNFTFSPVISNCLENVTSFSAFNAAIDRWEAAADANIEIYQQDSIDRYDGLDASACIGYAVDRAYEAKRERIRNTRLLYTDCVVFPPAEKTTGIDCYEIPERFRYFYSRPPVPYALSNCADSCQQFPNGPIISNCFNNVRSYSHLRGELNDWYDNTEHMINLHFDWVLSQWPHLPSCVEYWRNTALSYAASQVGNTMQLYEDCLKAQPPDENDNDGNPRKGDPEEPDPDGPGRPGLCPGVPYTATVFGNWPPAPYPLVSCQDACPISSWRNPLGNCFTNINGYGHLRRHLNSWVDLAQDRINLYYERLAARYPDVPPDCIHRWQSRAENTMSERVQATMDLYTECSALTTPDEDELDDKPH